MLGKELLIKINMYWIICCQNLALQGSSFIWSLRLVSARARNVWMGRLLSLRVPTQVRILQTTQQVKNNNKTFIYWIICYSERNLTICCSLIVVNDANNCWLEWTECKSLFWVLILTLLLLLVLSPCSWTEQKSYFENWCLIFLFWDWSSLMSLSVKMTANWVYAAFLLSFAHKHGGIFSHKNRFYPLI